MSGIQYRPGSDSMPGYVASVRRIGKYHSLRGAWNSLDLFTANDAASFLAEKLDHIHNVSKKDVKDVALDIILGFGVLAVEAEREEVAALAAIDKGRPSEKAPGETPW